MQCKNSEIKQIRRRWSRRWVTKTKAFLTWFSRSGVSVGEIRWRDISDILKGHFKKNTCISHGRLVKDKLENELFCCSKHWWVTSGDLTLIAFNNNKKRKRTATKSNDHPILQSTDKFVLILSVCLSKWLDGHYLTSQRGKELQSTNCPHHHHHRRRHHHQQHCTLQLDILLVFIK